MRNTDAAGQSLGARAEAALWHERMNGDHVDSATRAAFDEWHLASPAHAQAYLEVAAAWQMAVEVRDSPPILALRHETSTRLAVTTRQLTRRLGIAAGIAIVFAGLGLGLHLGRQVNQQRAAEQAMASEVYQTRVGERMALTLVDGSTVTLNTASRLRVRYSETERYLILDAGQALFNVAKAQTQPFIVSAGGRRITAHGTEFDVRVEQESVKVALVEGLVSVRNERRPAAREIRLNPNEVLAAGEDFESVHTVQDVAKLLSWRDGLLVFEDEALGAAVAEMNRYVKRPIVLADPGLAKLRISGAFRAGSTGAFVDAVTHLFPVKVFENTPERILLGGTSERPSA